MTSIAIKQEIKQQFWEARWYIGKKMKDAAKKELHKVQDTLNTKLARGLTLFDCMSLQKSLDSLMTKANKLKDETIEEEEATCGICGKTLPESEINMMDQAEDICINC